jgi:hypothetical protein
MKKIMTTLAVTLAVVSGLAGSAFADNKLDQTSFDPLSPNTAILSNNDLLSDNKTDVGNDKSKSSHNDGSTDDSHNVDVKIKDSGNDYSKTSYDSHDDNSKNQLAFGQVNVNGSYTGDINAADHGSTILDGDVSLGGGYGWYGSGGSSDNNINTGILANSIQGDNSAQFTNVGIGLNNTGISHSSLNNSQTSNVNILSPFPRLHSHDV